MSCRGPAAETAETRNAAHLWDDVGADLCHLAVPVVVVVIVVAAVVLVVHGCPGLR